VEHFFESISIDGENHSHARRKAILWSLVFFFRVFLSGKAKRHIHVKQDLIVTIPALLVQIYDRRAMFNALGVRKEAVQATHASLNEY